MKTVAWVIGYRALNLTIVFAQDYLSLVGADENFALRQPAVSGVVLRDMAVLLLRNLPGLNL